MKTILLTIIVCLSACSTTQLYEGKKLDPSMVAIIKGDSDLNILQSAAIVIKKVDGKEIGLGSNKVELLPGNHSIEVSCQFPSMGSYNRHTIEKNVEAGKIYSLGLRVESGEKKCEGVIIEE